jgi:NAD(P)H-dependent FMN reductase
MAERIVGLGGSLARASESRAALKRALERAAGAGAETRLLVWGAEIRFMLRGCTHESVHQADLGA